MALLNLSENTSTSPTPIATKKSSFFSASIALEIFFIILLLVLILFCLHFINLINLGSILPPLSSLPHLPNKKVISALPSSVQTADQLTTYGIVTKYVSPTYLPPLDPVHRDYQKNKAYDAISLVWRSNVGTKTPNFVSGQILTHITKNKADAATIRMSAQQSQAPTLTNANISGIIQNYLVPSSLANLKWTCKNNSICLAESISSIEKTKAIVYTYPKIPDRLFILVCYVSSSSSLFHTNNYCMTDKEVPTL